MGDKSNIGEQIKWVIDEEFRKLVAAILRQIRAPHTAQDVLGPLINLNNVLAQFQENNNASHEVNAIVRTALNDAMDNGIPRDRSSDVAWVDGAKKSVIAGSLRLLAGAVLHQTLQTSHGRKDLHNALDGWATAREELRDLRRRQGWNV
jgi:hypothetical protein